VQEVAGVALPFLLVGAIAAAALFWQYRRLRRLRDGLHRLVSRDRLRLTDRPCGLDPDQCAGRFAATPRGDRRYGMRYAVEGPTDLTLDGRPHRIELGCFEWWYETRVQTDKSTSYQRRTTTVAAARLPMVVPARIEVKPEGILGRVGLRRADQQLESEEFNRRFHVRGSDQRMTVQFLDAAMQHRLLTTAIGRSIHLEHDLLLLGGSPEHRDPTLPGVIGELPAAAQDALGLLRAVPAQIWRAASPVADPRGAP
jgi:hypothetical protein